MCTNMQFESEWEAEDEYSEDGNHNATGCSVQPKSDSGDNPVDEMADDEEERPSRFRAVNMAGQVSDGSAP